LVDDNLFPKHLSASDYLYDNSEPQFDKLEDETLSQVVSLSIKDKFKIKEICSQIYDKNEQLTLKMFKELDHEVFLD